MEVSDWLDQAVQRTKEKYQEQRALEDKLVQEEALRGRLAGQFCGELFDWLQMIDVKFNNRFGALVLTVTAIGTNGDRSLRILAQPVRAQERLAVLNYQKETKSIRLKIDCCHTTAPAQVIELVLDGDRAVLAEIGADHYTPQQLGCKVIDDLLA